LRIDLPAFVIPTPLQRDSFPVRHEWRHLELVSIEGRDADAQKSATPDEPACFAAFRTRHFLQLSDVESRSSVEVQRTRIPYSIRIGLFSK
jgi:hypothetical protein